MRLSKPKKPLRLSPVCENWLPAELEMEIGRIVVHYCQIDSFHQSSTKTARGNL